MAPYGVDKSIGGDSKENDSWMERCVTRVQEGGKSKSNAIAICKAQLKKNKSKKSELVEEVDIDDEVVSRFMSFQEQWIRKCMSKGKSFSEANSLFDSYLALNNFSY